MGRLRASDVATLCAVLFAGVYGGTRFFEPMIIDKLREMDALRDDIPIPVYDKDGNRVIDLGPTIVPKNVDNTDNNKTNNTDEKNI
ncbi:Ecm19p ASCRUDRAFT_136721 [Ascoidea rubescens DSM 1968]|uniref:Uncharacterized protein n=1 Tax=Ascoidea rubescens DSM 1968 TaxID=1344418 RepID=A0A1D2VLZ6_9ASCO|nr:hypothetical protein ASCRUDRAFT_136721 [Ascoidea rubescens DSM 1968]ODV62633.1 hypothetical protein ASCRUDRAFT_136721 [Ascoidea rubescens DSM 1968]